MAQKLALDELPDWPLLLNIEEASRYIGISSNMFRDLDPVEKIYLSEKTVRYHRDDLKAWVEFLKQGTSKNTNSSLIEGMLN
ncbi:hypothetical protein MTBPR1_30038 [Candidatus Terasakiella magnetica]|uniref:Helix-turn-helix domain-containing protein n=1 Tax=Candidatus Terasakiella magnetica TaxID=1867952 RepID=A0A1C3RHB1_9PROT|nr:hypothetical protein [Candidatus Terasakiella magnetica]SCA56668.1 hypothetical protein MTBPR1_30038 [Candidatus Terasakiella magnetica]